MSERTRESYRGTALIARTYRNSIRGKAWIEGREIASIEGESEADVLTTLRALVDDAFTIEQEPGSVAYPSAEDYLAAVQANLARFTAKYRLMLQAHYKARGRSATIRELAAAASYPTWSSANLHYGKVGRMLAESMLFQPRPRANGDPHWILMLAECDDDSLPDSERTWRMRDAVAEALKGAGVV